MREFSTLSAAVAAGDGGGSGEAVSTIAIGLITLLATAAIMYLIARHG